MRMAQRHRPEGTTGSKKEKQAPTARQKTQPVSVYHGSDKPQADSDQPKVTAQSDIKQKKHKIICLFCKSAEHYLSQCPEIAQHTTQQVEKWITDGKRCRKCGRTSHGPETCTLKKACSECQEVHLKVLHNIAKTD